MTDSLSTRKIFSRGWRLALLIAVAVMSVGCPDPNGSDDTVTRVEKWTLHGILYEIEFNTFGNVVDVIRLTGDNKNFSPQVGIPETNRLLNARQYTLNSRAVAGATAQFVQKRAASAAGSSPVVYLLSTNGFLERFNPSNPAAAPTVNNLVCSSANTLGAGTRNFAVTPDGSLALIATIPAIAGAATATSTPCVVFADLNAMQVVNVLPLPATVGTPGGIAITPDGRYAYLITSAAYQNPCIVYVIDIAAVKILTTIPVDADGQSVNEIVMAPDGSVAYVGCNDCGLESIPVIDILTNSLSSPIPVQTANEGSALALHPNGSKLYVVPYFGEAVTIIDTSSFKAIGTIPAQSPAGGPHPPPGLDPIFTPDGRFLMMLNAPAAITVVDTTTDRVDSQIPVSGTLTAPGTFISFFFVPDTTAQ